MTQLVGLALTPYKGRQLPCKDISGLPLGPSGYVRAPAAVDWFPTSLRSLVGELRFHTWPKIFFLNKDKGISMPVGHYLTQSIQSLILLYYR